MTKTKLKCPNCGNKSLVERGVNTLRNIRLRKKNNRYDDYYCEDCAETFSEDLVEVELQLDLDGTNATEW